MSQFEIKFRVHEKHLGKALAALDPVPLDDLSTALVKDPKPTAAGIARAKAAINATGPRETHALALLKGPAPEKPARVKGLLEAFATIFVPDCNGKNFTTAEAVKWNKGYGGTPKGTGSLLVRAVEKRLIKRVGKGVYAPIVEKSRG